MTEEEKRLKVIKHKARMTGYFFKMLTALISVPVCFLLSVNTDGILFVLCFVLVFISIMTALVFKMLHLGMLYCPLCGATFGYTSWMTASMPYTCPHCGEKLNY